MNQTAVVILNWNGIKFLEKFLPTVLACSQNADIIVADNGSADDSVAFVKANFGAVQVLELGANYGFADGYNRALKLIDYTYFVLLNSDVEVTENWLEPLVNVLKNEPDTAACQPKMLSYANKTAFEYAGAAGGFIDRFGYPFCRGRILNEIENDYGQYNEGTEIFWASGACLVIKSDVYNKMNGFDSGFFAHMEEIDLCWRIWNNGFKIKYVPQSTVYHVGGGTLPNESPFKLYLNFRNNLYMLTKNLPKSKLVSTLIFRMILDGIAGIVYIKNGKFRNFGVILKAHAHFYKALPALLQQRKNLKQLPTIAHIYKNSILWSFFINRNKTYNELISK